MKRIVIILFLVSQITFAQKWSAFPSATSINATDYSALVQSGINKKYTFSVLRGYLDTAYVRIATKQYITGKKVFTDSVSFRKNVYMNGLFDFTSVGQLKLPLTLYNGIGSVAFDSSVNRITFKEKTYVIDTVASYKQNNRFTGTNRFIKDLSLVDTSLIYANIYTAVAGVDIKGVHSYVYTSSNPTASNIYAGYFNALGSGTSGGSKSYGLYATASGSNSNYAGYFNEGSVYVKRDMFIANAKFNVDTSGNIKKWANKVIDPIPATDTTKVMYSNGKWKIPVATADTTINYHWMGLHNFEQDSIKIGGLWYDFPATRIANSVLYDSLGNGILKWKVYPTGGTTIDTTKISYLAKAETFTGAKTFNGDLIFGASADLTLPTADPTPNVGKLWRSTDVLKYTNSAGDAKTLTFGTGTINELAYWSSANSLGTLPVATYPSLTELSYVKGLSSAIQTQLSGKLTTGLTSANIFVGNVSNIATGVAMSGDATIANTGAVTVADDSHAHTGSTISGLAVADFTSPNISNWTNDASYTTLATVVGASNTWTNYNYFNKPLEIGQASLVNGGVTIWNASNAFATTISSSTTTSNKTITLPNVTGTVALTSDLTNLTIAPATNSDNYIPLWNGANSKTLQNGLAYTSAATVSTIVGRDGSAHSAFNAITLGTAAQYGQLTIYGTVKNTLFTTQAATTDKWIEFPNLSGTVLLTTSSAASFPTLNQNTTGSSGSTTGNAATVTNGAYVSASNSFTASNNRFRNALYLGDDSYTTEGQLIFDNSGNAYTATLTAPNTTTSNKTITLPDATGTITLLETDQTFSGDISFDDAIILKETAVADTDTDIDATDKSYVRLGYTPGSYTIATISNGIAGQVLILCVTSSGNTWTVNNGTGANNVRLNGATNYAMGQYDTLTIIYDSGAGTWIETARSNN